MSRRSRRRVVRLQAALEARVRRFTESGDPSEVLDPAALDEASRLWEAAQPAGGDLQAVSVDVLTVLAHLYLSRWVLPEGQDQDDRRKAISLFGVLAGRAPERVPDQILSLLSAAQTEPVGDAQRLTTEGVSALNEYQRTGRPEVLDTAVTAFRNAVAATPARPPRPRRVPVEPGQLAGHPVRAGRGRRGPGRRDRRRAAGRRPDPARPPEPRHTPGEPGGPPAQAVPAGRGRRGPGRRDRRRAAGRRPDPARPPEPRHTPGEPGGLPGHPVRAGRGRRGPGRRDRRRAAGRRPDPARPPEPRHVPVEPGHLPARPVRAGRR